MRQFCRIRVYSFLMAAHTTTELGDAIRNERVRRGLSQADLAAQVGTTREWIGRLEAGAPRVELDKALRAANAVGISFTSQQTPTWNDLANDADRALLRTVVINMGLEGQHLTEDAKERILTDIVRERLTAGSQSHTAA